MGERYLTHESDDDRWESYRAEKKLGDWRDIGHKGANKDELITFQKIRPATSGAATTTPTTIR